LNSQNETKHINQLQEPIWDPVLDLLEGRSQGIGETEKDIMGDRDQDPPEEIEIEIMVKEDHWTDQEVDLEGDNLV